MRDTRHILVVDSNLAHGSTTALAIENAGGFGASIAGSADEALEALTLGGNLHNAVLIDLQPVSAAIALTAEMRARGVRVPILLVAAADTEEDVVGGLDAGANDYVVKPFRLAELVARLRAQMRVFNSSEDAVLVIGPYHFRPSSRTLTEPTSNRRVRLTEKEAAVLKHLYRAGSKPVPRHALLREVWGYSTEASTHTVETHIYRLRRKIEPNPDSARILLNQDGGYRLGYERGAPIQMVPPAEARPALAAAE